MLKAVKTEQLTWKLKVDRSPPQDSVLRHAGLKSRRKRCSQQRDSQVTQDERGVAVGRCAVKKERGSRRGGRVRREMPAAAYLLLTAARR